jgi:hypothetical protein
LFIAYGFFSEREHAKSLSAAAAFVDFTLGEREYISSALENKQHFWGNRSFESRTCFPFGCNYSPFITASE